MDKFDNKALQDQIVDILLAKDKQTGGHCGVSVPEIRLLTGVPIQEIKTQLNELYKVGSITWCQGKDGKLFKIKHT